jgi:uncharacterized protein with predicted RNA binding PUA domain
VFPEAERLRTVADYQFGAGAGAALFPPDEEQAVRRSSTGRPRQVHAGGERLVTLAEGGRFTLGIEGGRRLVAALSPPTARVAVGDESVPHVRDGRNAFAKFVRWVDPDVRPRDEVLVVHAGAADAAETLLAVGRARLPATGMEAFGTGVAVSVRESADG